MKLENDCRVRRSPLVWSVDLLCCALLAGITVLVACRYGALPDRIPTHYNAVGEIDGYGPKSMIWAVVAIAWTLVGVMSVVELFPRVWNVPVKVTKENQCRMLALTWHFLSTTKLIALGIFVYLTLMAVRGGHLSACFIPVVMSALVANTLYWTVSLIRNRNPPLNSLRVEERTSDRQP